MTDVLIVVTPNEIERLIHKGEISPDDPALDVFTFFTILADHYGYVPATNDVY